MDLIGTVVLGVSVVGFFIGVVVIVSGVLGRSGVAKSLSVIDTVYTAGRPGVAAERGPAVANRVGQIGRVATTERSLRWLRRWLDYGGNPAYWTVERVYEAKGLGLIILGLIGVVFGLLLGGGWGAAIGGLLGATLGFFIPELIIYQLGYQRQEAVQRTLPDILDTLTVSVEAGLGFDAALAQVTRYGRGPLAGEFARVLQEMQIGRSRAEALRAMAPRTRVPELKSFCSILIQASELGVPIASVLREQSKEMRVRRRQRAEELAQKVPVKILFPLIFCLFPSLFIVILGPAAISIYRLFLT